MVDWKPIGTAPLTGEELLLCALQRKVVYFGYYADDPASDKEGWVASSFTARPAEFCPIQPTHWAPLPPLPSEE